LVRLDELSLDSQFIDRRGFVFFTRGMSESFETCPALCKKSPIIDFT